VLPVGFAAHEPYCPYTARPSPRGNWTRPDLAAARRLIAASGRRGERVVLWMAPERRSVGRYLTALLNRLGLRATLRVPPGEGIAAIYDPGTRVQAGTTGWAADYLSPATFIETNFACPAAGDRSRLNLSRVCDRTLERRIDRALALPPADAATAWAAAEHRLTDLAAAVPMTQRRAVVLTSGRVGNVQHHAQWFTLLDQLWVR
jgi:peptide/nickel transport system substrate-binding protein